MLVTAGPSGLSAAVRWCGRRRRRWPDRLRLKRGDDRVVAVSDYREVLEDEDSRLRLVTAGAGGEQRRTRASATGTSGDDLTLPVAVTVANTYQLTVQPDRPTEPDPNDATPVTVTRAIAKP